MISLEVNAGGVNMKNPVALASGTCGYGEVYADALDPALPGAVVVKGISLEPRAGNPPPRMAETPCGMINSIGLENVGAEAFVREKLPWLADRGVTVVVNVFGESAEEYVAVCERVSEAKGVHGIELNVSCPNVKAGGMTFGSRPEIAADLVAKARGATGLPLWVKLSPDAGDIAAVAKAVEQAGADAISMINTIRAMAIDVETRKPVLNTVTGGLSGPAIKPIALRMVYEVAKEVSVPVVGIGGITEAEDAIEFMLAGATAVQVGTASMVDPTTPSRIISGIRSYLEENQIGSAAELTGAVRA